MHDIDTISETHNESHSDGPEAAEPAATPPEAPAPTATPPRTKARRRDPTRLTLGAYATQQLALEQRFLAKDAAKLSTVQNWQGHINALPATLMATRLTAIGKADCEAYFAALQAGPLADTTKETRQRFLHMLLQRARQEGLIARNPCTAVLRAQRHLQGRGVGVREITEAQTLSAAQVVTVLVVAACVEPPLFFVLVAVMVLTGLLGGEARALQRGDLELDYRCGPRRRPRLCVRRIEFNGTVSLAGWEERYVDVPPLLEAILRWWIATRGLTDPAAWLFPGPLPRQGSQRATQIPRGRTDWCVPTETVQASWRRIQARALPGSQRSLTALRHAFCSLSLQLGEEVLYVSVQVGHRTVKYTRQAYTAFLDVPGQGTGDASSEEALTAALGPAIARAAEVAERLRGQTPTPVEGATPTRRATRARSSRMK
ncbi:MAG: site-specific integrase [Nitrospira sp.]|nr:site-specific integrase [Nitrospira sp.]